MFDLSIALFARRCKRIGCGKSAGPFGVCQEHETQAVEKAFGWYVREGVSPIAPGCFKTPYQWKEYVVAYYLSRNPKLQREVQDVDYCKDCNPEYKRQMLAQGKCSHPETVFVSPERGVVIGVPLLNMNRPQAWEKALMGMSGEVVGMPPAHVIDSMVNGLSVKKKGGRPKKEKGDDDALTVSAID